MANTRSDVKAKEAFVNELKKRGYENPQVVSSPADIGATKDGKQWYFEMKMTKRETTYFGAATLTEWRQAFKDPEHFRFVVAMTDENEKEFKFIEITPQDMLKYCTIPPFKIYFNYPLGEEHKPSSGKKKRSKSVKLTRENFDKMDSLYESLVKGAE